MAEVFIAIILELVIHIPFVCIFTFHLTHLLCFRFRDCREVQYPGLKCRWLHHCPVEIVQDDVLEAQSSGSCSNVSITI